MSCNTCDSASIYSCAQSLVRGRRSVKLQCVNGAYTTGGGCACSDGELGKNEIKSSSVKRGKEEHVKSTSSELDEFKTLDYLFIMCTFEIFNFSMIFLDIAACSLRWRLHS